MYSKDIEKWLKDNQDFYNALKRLRVEIEDMRLWTDIAFDEELVKYALRYYSKKAEYEAKDVLDTFMQMEGLKC